MRLRSLEVRNFAAFPRADLAFSKGLNVFVGDNATGKTLLMRLPYAVMLSPLAQIVEDLYHLADTEDRAGGFGGGVALGWRH